MKSAALALGAGVITAGIVVAVVAVQARHGRDPLLQHRSYGPGHESFAFAAAPAGTDGPAAGCVVCHSLSKAEPSRSAPPLYGIVGAPKARVAWFSYSPALRGKGGVWSEGELDAYLANPSKFIPGTSKVLPPVSDAAKRRDIIAYLKTL